MLKAAELEAYRLLLRPYEPVSTVTTVSKLVATKVSGDLVDSLTDFERRVTSREHDAKETLSDLIKIGVAIKGLEKGGFSGSFAHQHSLHDRLDEICDRDRKR